jgi:hypothetical protein
VTWAVGGHGDPLPPAEGGLTLSRALVSLVTQAFQAREPERFGLLYAQIWRAHHGHLDLGDSADLDLRLARRWALAVRADAHRMRTLIRFAGTSATETPGGDGSRYVGWYAPDHYVLEATARLLARRDPARDFTIVTPDGTAHRDRDGLRFGAGLKNPSDDETLLAWWDAHRDAILAAANEGGGLPEAEELDEAPRPIDRPPLGPIVLPTSQTSATGALFRPRTRAYCLLGNSRAIRKTSSAVRSLARRDNYWMRRWNQRGSTGDGFTSPTPSSTLNSPRAAAGASTNRPRPKSSTFAAFGWTPSVPR